MLVIDLTHPIESGMPIWPGTPHPEITDLCTIPGDGFAERLFLFSSHTGTHVDLSAHMIEGGQTLEWVAAERFFGKALLIDLRDAGRGLMAAGQLQKLAGRDIAEAEFLLLHTGWSRFWGTEAYDSGFPVLSAEDASWLAASGLKGIGIDAPSFDEPESHHYPVHRILLEAGMILIENLKALCQLEQHQSQRVFLSVLPLLIPGAEASPIRAVALIPQSERELSN